MNRRQGVVLAIGLACLLGMVAYCPWHVVEPQMPGPPVLIDGAVIGGLDLPPRDVTVYAWQWSRPSPRLGPSSVQVDWVRLVVQAAAVGAVVGVGIWRLRHPAA